MTVKDLLPPVIVLTLFGFLVVHAGDDDGLRGLTVEEQMRDPNFWQNWYDPKPVLNKKERDKMLEPIKDRAISDDEIDRIDVARHLLPPPGDAVVGQLIAEVRRLRLTDAERQAVELAYSRLTADARYTAVAATLQGLLERLA